MSLGHALEASGAGELFMAFPSFLVSFIARGVQNIFLKHKKMSKPSDAYSHATA